METVTVSLEEAEVGEIKMIVMDEDAREALRFLTEKIPAQILKRENGK